MGASSNRSRKQPFREIQVLVSANLTFLTKGCNAGSIPAAPSNPMVVRA